MTTDAVSDDHGRVQVYSLIQELFPCLFSTFRLYYSKLARRGVGTLQIGKDDGTFYVHGNRRWFLADRCALGTHLAALDVLSSTKKVFVPVFCNMQFRKAAIASCSNLLHCATFECRGLQQLTGSGSPALCLWTHTGPSFLGMLISACLFLELTRTLQSPPS